MESLSRLTITARSSNWSETVSRRLKGIKYHHFLNLLCLSNKKRRGKSSENESLLPFPSLSLNNDPQLEFFSVSMRCSNAGLLALWLILCTQGHRDFNISPWHCRCVCASMCVHFCVQLVAVCVFYLSVSFIFALYFHQITNSNELPPAIIVHFSTDPTKRGGQSVLLCGFCMHRNRERKIIKICKTNTRCSLCSKWSIMYTNLTLYAIIISIILLLQKWLVGCESKTLSIKHGIVIIALWLFFLTAYIKKVN